MKLKILTKEQINKEVAKHIIDLINSKPNCVLGLATGTSPLGVYDLLVDAYKDKIVSFRNVITFNLDEYYPIEEINSQSYHYYMNEHLFSKIDILKDNTYFPQMNEDYDELIKSKGGIDVQILGIGRNGHIAFNEPNTPFNSLTHVVDLDDTTIVDNSRFFKHINEVPRQAITMGLTSIMNAKEIILIAAGKKKVEPIKKLLSKQISESFPASILNKHPNVTIYVDKEAMDLC